MSDQFTLKAATKVVGGNFCCELFGRVDLGVSSDWVTSALSPALAAADDGIFSMASCTSLLFFEKTPQALGVEGNPCILFVLSGWIVALLADVSIKLAQSFCHGCTNRLR